MENAAISNTTTTIDANKDYGEGGFLMLADCHHRCHLATTQQDDDGNDNNDVITLTPTIFPLVMSSELPTACTVDLAVAFNSEIILLIIKVEISWITWARSSG
jgi:hypothetical protein